MSHGLAAVDPGHVPRTVGIWLELPSDSRGIAQGDERIRLTRGLVLGLEAMPEVESIIMPCLPATEPIMNRLFGDVDQPGRLLSGKLRLVPAGRDPVWREAIAGWLRRRRERVVERLAAVGATPSPQTWRDSLHEVVGGQVSWPGAALRVVRRIAKLIRLSLAAWGADAMLAALGWLPSPYASVVADLGRRRLSAAWLLAVCGSASGRLLLGPKILDLGGVTVHAGAAGTRSAETLIGRLAAAADVVVAPSQHVVAVMSRPCAGRTVSVIPPAPLLPLRSAMDEHSSRAQLGEDLRGFFLGDGNAPLHRHFCDFPFERVEYLVAASSLVRTPILPAYAAILRRHRRDLKLIVDGVLPWSNAQCPEVHALGLSFDVAEAAGLSESARIRLLRHARAVVVPDLDGGCLPAVFAEAVSLGTPVLLGRTRAVREVITDKDLAHPEYFDVEHDGESAIRDAVLHVLDHAGEVLSRQQALVAKLAARTWRDVAAARLRLLERS